MVRVHGQIIAADDAPTSGSILLERVQLDSGRYPRPSWKETTTAFLMHQRLVSSLDYDMVSPPRLGLKIAPDTLVTLQTEDIDLRCWPPALDVTVPPGGPYPSDVLSLMLPTLPDLPLPVGVGHVVVRTFKPGETVTVIGEVARDGDLIVLRPPDHIPFVVSALPYDDIRSRLLAEKHGWEALTVALMVLGVLIGIAVMRGRSRL
jgi:hypothetical protein